MFDMLMEFIMPELLVLIPVLYLLGIMFKKSQIADKHIPLLLGLLSVVLCTLYVLSSANIAGYKEFATALFSSITQGVLCAGASVYVNQVIKQATKDE